ncbi:threonine synthase [Virgibacillus sp. W0181]|uniref:threonine synthase n=1 Tax=Virgibacillus sp. W0181 TaxID=3391581 RepID=UPI003F45DE73
MAFSYISHLYCSKCSLNYEHQSIWHLCSCGFPLLVAYDLEALRNNWKRSKLTERQNNLWRYHELLPVKQEESIVSLGEGMTPLVPMKNIGQTLAIDKLYMKDESLLPTGTFKARGAAVGISKAKELNVQQIVMPTNGNAGAAWSLYAARASIASKIVMPIHAPDITKKECIVSGAELLLVDGLISDAGKIAGQIVRDEQMYDAATLKEPYRIEGKKTMGLEIMEQLQWNIPDVIIYPTGGGVGLIGIYKAMKELQKIGWIRDNKLPRLVAVQAEGCAPIVKAWEEKKSMSNFWHDATTIAFGINVPKALGDFLVLDAIYHTAGCAVAVSDREMGRELEEVATREGAFICPEGAAAFSATRKLREDNWIKADETVVVLNTGAGIKYPDTVQVDSSVYPSSSKS